MTQFILAAVMMISGAQSAQYPVRDTETIRRVLEFVGANHTLELDNVSGAIHVTAGSGQSVEMTASKTVSAESREKIEEAKRDVKLDITDKAETIRIYVDGPFRCQCADGRDGWRSSGARWSEPAYRVDIDFDLRLPAGTKLRLRTVNNGDITVDRTTGDFEIENVNGRITMTDIRGSGTATTVNGAVNVSFLENPNSPSAFKSLNGVIEVAFQPNLSADLQMKTFNGGLYTDFEVKSLPAAAVNGERVNGRFLYRGNTFSGFRVGNGGPEIKFDGFNGDIRIVRRTR